MLGIIDKATGKVFAKSKKSDTAFSKLLDQIKVAYPHRNFMIGDVADNVQCVGDLPKKVEFVKIKKGS